MVPASRSEAGGSFIIDRIPETQAPDLILGNPGGPTWCSPAPRSHEGLPAVPHCIHLHVSAPHYSLLFTERQDCQL